MDSKDNGMGLDEFIGQAILDISTGIANAQKRAKTLSRVLVINQKIPTDVGAGSVELKHKVSIIKFELEVSVERKEEQTGGLKIYIAHAGIKSDQKALAKNKIQFELPVVFSAQEDE